MKARTLFLHFIWLALTAGLPKLSFSQNIPPLINYQGKLVNSNGLPVSTGDYQLRFRIYDAVANGNLIWGPQVFNSQTGPGYGPLVSVVQGWFNVILGPNDTNGTVIANAFTGANRFMEIQLGTNIPFGPRQQILTAPYALRAGSAASADIAVVAQIAITASNLVTSPIPRGLISMWSGSTTNIPVGWAICDGNNGTPDLRNRFIVGADQTQGAIAKSSIGGSPSQVGGSTSHNHGGQTGSHTLTIAEMPSHSHRLWQPNLSDGSGGAGVLTGTRIVDCGDGCSYYAGFFFQSGNVEATGGDQGHSHGITADNNVPPYFALAFIMKL